MSADGRRYAFEAFAGHGKGWVAVVDGKLGPKLYESVSGLSDYSEDGSSIAYAGAVSIGDSTAVIDGQIENPA